MTINTKTTDNRAVKARRTRELVITTMLAAIYVVVSTLSSLMLGTLTRGMETFLPRSLLFVILTAYTRQTTMYVLFGGVSGFILEIAVPNPVFPAVFVSLLVYGIIFGAFSSLTSIEHPISFITILYATILASAGMAVSALFIFTAVGFFPAEFLGLIWIGGIIRDVILGLIGSGVGYWMLQHVAFSNFLRETGLS